MRTRKAEYEFRPEEKRKKYYLCNGKKCDGCKNGPNRYCRHTTDINFAADPLYDSWSVEANGLWQRKKKDEFYNSKAWKEKRKHILLRDRWTDQILIKEGVTYEADTVHHILPRELYPEYALEDWNLISVNNSRTHKGRLHVKYSGDLTKEGKALMIKTAAAHGVKLTTTTMVIGKPGTGKSTWTHDHLGGGLAYEMDSIACAFRLARPHEEAINDGARRMAASMRSAWIAAAHNFAAHIFVVRTAPTADELAETMPDRLIVCEKQWVKRPYVYDDTDYQKQINNAIEWAEENGVTVEYVPPRFPRA